MWITRLQNLSAPMRISEISFDRHGLRQEFPKLFLFFCFLLCYNKNHPIQYG